MRSKGSSLIFRIILHAQVSVFLGTHALSAFLQQKEGSEMAKCREDGMK